MGADAMIIGIWAQSRDGIMGDGDRLPWHEPQDLANFRRLTKGHTVVMGRKTWESLPTKPLPDRRNIIISSRPAGEWSQGAYVWPDLIGLSEFAGPVFIIGGRELIDSTRHMMDMEVVTTLNIDVRDTCANPIEAPPRSDKSTSDRPNPQPDRKPNENTD